MKLNSAERKLGWGYVHIEMTEYVSFKTRKIVEEISEPTTVWFQVVEQIMDGLREA